MINWRDIANLQIFRVLRIKKNANLEVENADGTTSTIDLTELGVLDGLTATTAELNTMDGITATTAELNILDGVTATAAELNILDGVTATAAELNILDGVTATAAELNILDGVTATAAEINAVADVSANHEAVTTTNVITAAETGKRFVLNSATGFVSTLPAPALGLEFWFYTGGTPPTSGNHTVVTNSSANIIEGNISSPEDAAGSVSVAAAGDTISFVANLTVQGDFAHVWCDGTDWYADGMCRVQNGMTITQAT